MEENNKMKKQSRSVMRTQNLLKTGLIELMQEKSVQQIEDEQRAGNAGVFLLLLHFRLYRPPLRPNLCFTAFRPWPLYEPSFVGTKLSFAFRKFVSPFTVRRTSLMEKGWPYCSASAFAWSMEK